jgi:F-type H+-transporting ATPase subunit a
MTSRWLLLSLVLTLGLFGGATCGAARAADDGHHGHHEPAPQDEVMDQIYEWHFFDNTAFSFKIPLGWFKIFGYPFPTKFEILQLFAAGTIAWLVIGLAKRMQTGDPVQGPLWNALEAVALFIRDEIARPYMGGHEDHHDDHAAHDEHGHDTHDHAAHADHGHAATASKYENPGDAYVPYLLAIFLFILAMNVFGLIPFLGSPTANICVTGALALCSFLMIHGSAIAKNGFANYMGSMWLNIDIPPMFGIGPITFGGALGLFIKVLIFFLELFGTVIKCFVLAVRLFANIFAGHMVVASILFFIFLAKDSSPLLWGTVTIASVLGVISLSLLELFVAFLQAYIFVFLTALFTGMAVNPEH